MDKIVTDNDYFSIIDNELNGTTGQQDELNQDNRINPNDFIFINQLKSVEHLPKPKKLFGNLLMQYDFAIIAGATNQGKSVFAYHLTSILAKGISYSPELQNEMEGQPQRVLVCDYEQSIRQLVNRYPFYPSMFNENVFVVTPEKIPILNEDVLCQLIESINPQVLIIDNLSSIDIGDGDISKPDDARRFIQAMLRIRNKYQITMIIITHYVKGYNNDGLPNLDMIQGAKTLGNLSDTVLQFGKIKEQVFIRHTKGRFSQKDENRLLLLNVEMDENLIIHSSGFATEKELKNTSNDLSDLVQMVFSDKTEIRHSDIQKRIEDIKGLEKAKAKYIVNKMINDNLIFKQENGSYIINGNEI